MHVSPTKDWERSRWICSATIYRTQLCSDLVFFLKASRMNKVYLDCMCALLDQLCDILKTLPWHTATTSK
jgi:hypothetical protein